MKTNQQAIRSGLVGCVALLAVGDVVAGNDNDTCRAGYKTLLMTPAECTHYLQEIKAARSRSDHMTVIDLQEWHTQLLLERSQACPCESKPARMQKVRMISNSLPQSAYSTRN